MNKIKVIDLLNMISKGEDVPKKIKWENIIYAYSEYDKDYLEYPFSDEEMKRLYDKLQQENQDLKEKIILLKASEPMLELEKYYGERDKYKEVIEEVRDYILNHELVEEKNHYVLNGNELLQILDKSKERINNIVRKD